MINVTWDQNLDQGGSERKKEHPGPVKTKSPISVSNKN